MSRKDGAIGCKAFDVSASDSARQLTNEGQRESDDKVIFDPPLDMYRKSSDVVT